MTTKHVCTIYIKASPETVWNALTDGEFTCRYFHSTRIESSWEKGATVTYYNQDESIAVDGQILESNKPHLLSFTWHVHYNSIAEKEKPSRVVFELEAVEDATRLTLTHDNFVQASVVHPEISKGWIAILSNLKTLLETGDVMAVS